MVPLWGTAMKAKAPPPTGAAGQDGDHSGPSDLGCGLRVLSSCAGLGVGLAWDLLFG